MVLDEYRAAFICILPSDCFSHVLYTKRFDQLFLFFSITGGVLGQETKLWEVLRVYSHVRGQTTASITLAKLPGTKYKLKIKRALRESMEHFYIFMGAALQKQASYSSCTQYVSSPSNCLYLQECFLVPSLLYSVQLATSGLNVRPVSVTWSWPIKSLEPGTKIL